MDLPVYDHQHAPSAEEHPSPIILPDEPQFLEILFGNFNISDSQTSSTESLGDQYPWIESV